MNRNALIIPIVLLCVALSGCGSDGMSDLRQWVQDERKGRKPRPKPIPEIKTTESFTYTAESLADPFAPFNLKPQGPGGSGPRPEPGRRKEPLEEYPLDALRMVGTLTRRNQSWVVIQAPNGAVHRAKVGDHMGQNFGRVTKITEEKVDLVELIQNPVGDWVEREAKLAITE